MLDKLNYFRDPNFRFDPIEHSYTYYDELGKPVQVFEPVSGFISQFKKPFDSKTISKFVARKQNKSQQQVLDEWAATAKEGTDLGSMVHEWIEDYYNGKNPPMPESLTTEEDQFFADLGIGDSIDIAERARDRINKFLQLHEERLHKLDAKEQEFRIFSRKWGIAGTLDILFHLNGKFYVGDWKTNKKFTTDDHPDGRRQKMLYPFDDLWDNSLNGYSLQISTYRLMLQEEAGFETDGGFLVWLGPDEKPQLYKTLDLRDRLKEWLDKNNL